MIDSVVFYCSTVINANPTLIMTLVMTTPNQISYILISRIILLTLLLQSKTIIVNGFQFPSSAISLSKYNIQQRSSLLASFFNQITTDRREVTIMSSSSVNEESTNSVPSWSKDNVQHVQYARDNLKIWPLDDYNVKLLNEVHPKSWTSSCTENKDDNKVEASNNSEETDSNIPLYDLVVIGAGAGGLVSSRQAARRGAKSVMISSHLAGGDCLNVGCVPSKALIRCSKLIQEIRNVQQHSDFFGIHMSPNYHNQNDNGGNIVQANFQQIMKRMRKLRADIAPIDGHTRGSEIGVKVLQGFGRFVDSNKIEVLSVDHESDDASSTAKSTFLKFKKAAICTGGRAMVPSNIKGLQSAPYTTNETLFNLSTLPPRMIILGSGVIALEMAQTFATFGSKVTVLIRGDGLFPNHDSDVGSTLRELLKEKNDIEFLTHASIENVETIKDYIFHDNNNDELPLMKLTIHTNDEVIERECECLLVATGRIPNIEKLNLEAANIAYDVNNGILVDDLARSVTNPNVYSVGDCTAGVPRLTHMSGEMAKVVVQNALFNDEWRLSSLVVPACMYTEPEFASVGVTKHTPDEIDVYKASFEHNDRSILDNKQEGFVKVFCKKGTGTILGATIIGSHAGEMINELTLAMKYGISLEQVGRNIHCYPTYGEAIMSCGIQLINKNWKRYEG